MTTRQLERLKAHDMIYRQEVTPLHNSIPTKEDSNINIDSIEEHTRPKLAFSPEPAAIAAINARKPSTAVTYNNQ